MDQIRTALAFVKKQWFWFSCLAICLLTAGMWFWSTSSLKASFQKRHDVIKTTFSEASTLSREAKHPNPTVKEKMDERINNLKNSVRTAWQKQYSEQGEEVFVWPAALPKLRAVADKLRPVEALGFAEGEPVNEKLRLSVSYRSDYANYIRRELPKLAEIVGAVWAPSGGGGDAGGNAGMGAAPGALQPVDGISGDEEEIEPVVLWSTSNQSEIQESRFNWSHHHDRSPTTIELLYAQEDFWVLQSLMQIIRETNQGATSPHQKEAVIRRIDFIQLGRNASAAVGDTIRFSPRTRSGSGNPGEMPEGNEPQPIGPPQGAGGLGEGMMGAGGIGGGPGETAMAGSSADPAHLRYVDTKYQPIPAEDLRSARESTDPELAYLAVAKRMPVRMRVRINQLAIPRFLSACANADLTVEVRQMRMNRSSGQDGSGGGGGGGGGGILGGGQPGASPFGATEGMGAIAGGGMGGASSQDLFPWDVDVEIYGIVYIYNPVDDEKLKYVDEEDVTPDVAQVGG